jgi:hypothetical protein
MHWGVLVLAAVLVVYGEEHLTQATQGVGLVATGIFLVAVARILQAANYHRKAFPPTPKVKQID